MAAVPAVPADRGALADLPADDAGADGVNDPGDLVAGHTRVLQAGPRPLLGKRVTVTDATRLDPNSHRPRAGLWDLALDELERTVGITHLSRSHRGHRGSVRSRN